MKRTNQLQIYLLAFILCFSAFAVNAQQRPGVWCVAKTGIPVKDLLDTVDYVCGRGYYPDLDCKPIQMNGSCWEPNTSSNHASYALNLYYRNYGACPTVSGIATYVNIDPSFGTCIFPLAKLRKEGFDL